MPDSTAVTCSRAAVRPIPRRGAAGRGRPPQAAARRAGLEREHEALLREREALERERQATRELRALDDMKNLFLSAVSHELRNPLAGVVGIALTLRQARSRLAEEDVADLLDRLVKSADKLQGLLGDLLDLDRLNRGIVTPKLRSTDVAVLISRIAEQWEQESDRTLEVAVESVVAQVDPDMVERIVENLLANADRHTPPDTPVWIRTSRHDQGVLIMVEDAGAGIPSELRAPYSSRSARGRSIPAMPPASASG
jgi:two-component system, OmpR family, sensor histidine kinase KdpD